MWTAAPLLLPGSHALCSLVKMAISIAPECMQDRMLSADLNQLDYAAAVEAVHAYSLIRRSPMDDDHLRRGP